MGEDTRFDSVEYDNLAVEKQAEFKRQFVSLAKDVEVLLPNGRAKSLVYTKLEEAYMWVGKAIRDEQISRNPQQDQRSDS